MLNILLGKSSSGTLQAAETAKLEAAAVPPSSRSSAPTKRQAARAQRQQEMRQRLDTMRQERQEQQQEREEQQEPQRQRQQAEQLHHQHAEASALQDQQAAETQAGIGVDAQPPPSLLVRAGGLIRHAWLPYVALVVKQLFGMQLVGGLCLTMVLFVNSYWCAM